MFKISDIIRNITIEPIFFLYGLCFGFYIIASSSLYVSKVCNVNLNYTREICDNIQEHTEEQIKVQEYVSSLQAYNSVIQAIPSCVYALLAGPWSDRHGRKFLITCALFGYIISNGVFLINTYFFYELKAEYLLFECLQDLTGGSPVFYIACYSYISDISEPEMRTKRIAFLDGVFPLGYYLGNSLSGLIKIRLGFAYNFGLGMLSATLAVLYCIFFVKDSHTQRDERLEKQLAEEVHEIHSNHETIPTDKYSEEGPLSSNVKSTEDVENEKTTNKANYLYDLFHPNNLKEGFEAVLKKRDRHRRTFIILLVLAFQLEIFAQRGLYRSSHFLYFRRVLNWSELEYSRYTTVLGVIGLLAQYVAVPILANKCKLHDSTIALIDSFTSIGNLFVIAFCVNEWMLYIGGVFALLDSTSTTMFRSLISKNVHANEIGRVFSVVGVLVALLPFASGPIFGLLYKSTVSYQPNAFIFLVIGIKVVLFVVVYVVNIGMRREAKQYGKRKLGLELISKEEQLQLQIELVSENRDNLVSHNIAAETLAYNATDDQSCSGSTN